MIRVVDDGAGQHAALPLTSASHLEANRYRIAMKLIDGMAIPELKSA